MNRPQPTSQEKLDRMLASSAITAEDYRRLSQAMHASDAAEAEASDALGAPAAKRLRKNWSRRRLAGVCAGLADYFALDPVMVRGIALALLVVAFPLTLLCYLVLALFALPWDDPAAAQAEGPPTHPWRFALGVLLLLEAIPLGLRLLVLPRFVPIFEGMGGTLPIVTQLALRALYYSHAGLSAATFVHVLRAALAAGLLTAIYIACPNPTVRRVCGWAAVLWPAFLFFALCWPLATMGSGMTMR